MTRTLVIPDIHMRCAMVDESLATLASQYDQIAGGLVRCGRVSLEFRNAA